MEVNTITALSFDAEAAAKNPVAKVVTLIKDMLKQMEKEAESDQEIYDAMACWCETNDKVKTKSIADAEQLIKDLTASIEEFTARSSQLTVDVAQLKKEIGSNNG